MRDQLWPTLGGVADRAASSARAVSNQQRIRVQLCRVLVVAVNEARRFRIMNGRLNPCSLLSLVSLAFSSAPL